jgi:hypothetical protein
MLAQSGFRVFIAEQAPLPDPRYPGATVQSIYIAVPGKGQAGTGSYIEEVAKKIEKLEDVMHRPSYGYITDIEGVMREHPELKPVCPGENETLYFLHISLLKEENLKAKTEELPSHDGAALQLPPDFNPNDYRGR